MLKIVKISSISEMVNVHDSARSFSVCKNYVKDYSQPASFISKTWPIRSPKNFDPLNDTSGYWKAFQAIESGSMLKRGSKTMKSERVEVLKYRLCLRIERGRTKTKKIVFVLHSGACLRVSRKFLSRILPRISFTNPFTIPIRGLSAAENLNSWRSFPSKAESLRETDTGEERKYLFVYVLIISNIWMDYVYFL